MFNWEIKILAWISICNHVSALKIYKRAKSRNLTADILSLLGHSYLHFQILKAFRKDLIIFNFTVCSKIF